MKEYDAEDGKVIVVETTTGKIRANVGLVKRDKKYEADADVRLYDNKVLGHMTNLYQAIPLLAILENGKLSPDSIIDTRNGIYNTNLSNGCNVTIYDHNWRRGGYGKLSIRDVYAKGSLVGMMKARKQNGYGKEYEIMEYSHVERDNYKIHLRVDCMMCELGFYNGIANNGKVIRLIDKEDTTDIINPQIAKAEKMTV